MLNSRVDAYLRHQLQDLQNAKGGTEDGHEALILLRMLFADDKDMDYQQYALNAFRTVSIKPNETVFDFNKRFGILHRNVVSAGLFFSDID